ncbi:MAG: DUF1573 domain-containing protein [Candidatus Spechtbacteria bacterium]|nr:DUF1573 domain-containing protein [Candidatus Spechtbacteria bacterium]
MTNQIKTIALYGVGAVLFLGVIVYLGTAGQKNSGVSAGASEFSASALHVVGDTNFDFGTISMANGRVNHEFNVVNDGNEPVHIYKVYTTCMCTTATIIDEAGNELGKFGMPGHGGASSAADITVAPGKKVKVTAIFDPAAHGPSGVGLAQRSVYLETNSQKFPKVVFDFQAMVTQ